MQMTKYLMLQVIVLKVLLIHLKIIQQGVLRRQLFAFCVVTVNDEYKKPMLKRSVKG